MIGMRKSAAVGHVVTTKRVYKGRTYSSHLLRQSYREGGKVKKRTIANLTPLGDEIVGVVKAMLAGQLVSVVDELFTLTSTLPHGHVDAVLTVMRRLGVSELLAGRSSRERSLVLGLIAQRVIDPMSKLATTRAWLSTTLSAELGISDASEDEVYLAMDWLLARQERIEDRLAERHLGEGARVMFDLSSTYLEGDKCRLARFGYSRDRKRGKKQVNWGLLTDSEGRPVSVTVYAGNTSDSTTLMEQVEDVKARFGLSEFTIVGDRGMIVGNKIPELRKVPGVTWITALKSEAIQPLIVEGIIQPSLFDETNLVELAHDGYPGERLIACRDPVVGRKRAHVRAELLATTTAALEKLRVRVSRGKLKTSSDIGVAAGKIIGSHKMSKHIHLTIGEGVFEYRIDEVSVAAEAKLDAIYIIRTSVPVEEMNAQETVLAYKDLSKVEQAFRTSKSFELLVRPVHHHLDDRVRAHFLITMLAYYVKWHMQTAWASLTFTDEEAKPAGRDPVKRAERSQAAETKARRNQLPNGDRPHSFKTLLESLATIARCTYHYPSAPAATFEMVTEPNPEQAQALKLLESISL